MSKRKRPRGKPQGTTLFKLETRQSAEMAAGRAALATCSPQGLEIKGRVQVAGTGTSWAHPVVIGGRLYLRYDTNLYCYDVRAK